MAYSFTHVLIIFIFLSLFFVYFNFPKSIAKENYFNSLLMGIIAAPVMIGLIFYFSGPYDFAKNKEIIILLNGPSAAGKTSIQKEFQKFYDEQFLRLGIDTLLIAPLHERFGAPDSPIMSSEKKEENGIKEFKVFFGPQGHKIIFGMHRALAGYAAAGNNLIVDYIQYHPEWRLDLLKELYSYNVYTVGIKTPLSVIEERERSRATSPEGHARAHYDSVHEGWVYDLEINAANESAEQIAQKIKEHIEKNKPHAFLEMSRKLSVKETLSFWLRAFLGNYWN